MEFYQNGQLPAIGSYYPENVTPGLTTNGQQGILSMPQSALNGNQYFSHSGDFSAFQPHQQYATDTDQSDQAVEPKRAAMYVGGGGDETRGEDGGQDNRKPDPFAPECSIPLPYQLGDEYNYYGPNAVWKRNERERHRVRCVNDGYDKLRNHLPVPGDKRLSKVETLRFAIRYIQHLEKMLTDSNHDEQCDCDFMIRASSASDSCQSPAVSINDQHRNGSRAKKQRRRSCDEGSDES